MRTSTPFPLLRTYLSTAGRSFRIVLINLLNLVSLAASLVGFSLQSLTLIVASSVGLAIGVTAIAANTFTWYRAVQDLRLHCGPQSARALRVPQRLADSGYEILLRRSHPADGLLTSRQVNAILFNGGTSALLSEQAHFRPAHSAPISHVLLREFTQKKSVVLFNDLKVRLTSDLLLTPDASLTTTRIQPTRYFDTLITNNAVDVRLTSYRSRTEIFDGGDYCFPRHVVPTCEQSRCANQIGGSALAVTSDDYLVWVEQGRRSNVSSNLLAPAGSGTADWEDIGALSDLQHFVKRFVRRELIEECGLNDTDISWIRIIGFGRLLYRGGLPQFFCLARLSCPLANIRVTRSERSLIDYHMWADVYSGEQSYYQAIRQAIDKLRKEDYRISSSLWWNLELLSRLPADALQSAFAAVLTP